MEHEEIKQNQSIKKNIPPNNPSTISPTSDEEISMQATRAIIDN